MGIERGSETWQAVVSWTREREAELMERILEDLDAVGTARCRAQVSLLREIRELGTPMQYVEGDYAP